MLVLIQAMGMIDKLVAYEGRHTRSHLSPSWTTPPLKGSDNAENCELPCG